MEMAWPWLVGWEKVSEDGNREPLPGREGGKPLLVTREPGVVLSRGSGSFC